jgi:acyl-CoA synthetase (AMP-forming)/AMP-acid ligase II
MTVLVADENLEAVAPGQDGELLVKGPQTSLGYWKDPEKTARAFVEPPNTSGVYYRTGDRVRRPSAAGPLTHLGRMDSQIKIRGHRVELGEIEAVVRAACGLDGVVAVPLPVTENGCDGVEVFIQSEREDVESLREAVAEKLPDYMVPRRFHFLERLPLNVNGKFDRKALAERLKEGV